VNGSEKRQRMQNGTVRLQVGLGLTGRGNGPCRHGPGIHRGFAARSFSLPPNLSENRDDPEKTEVGAEEMSYSVRSRPTVTDVHS
jgi:hypothetical protein